MYIYIYKYLRYLIIFVRWRKFEDNCSSNQLMHSCSYHITPVSGKGDSPK